MPSMISPSALFLLVWQRRLPPQNLNQLLTFLSNPARPPLQYCTSTGTVLARVLLYYSTVLVQVKDLEEQKRTKYKINCCTVPGCTAVLIVRVVSYEYEYEYDV